VKRVVSEKREVLSESLILYLAKLLDLFATLDAVKNMKASLNNDFSFYKRYYCGLRLFYHPRFLYRHSFNAHAEPCSSSG
jgi:hypothetical protein